MQKVLSVSAVRQTIDLTGVHFGTPGPPYANVVGPRLVGKCTTVPPHLRFVVLQNPPIIYAHSVYV